VLPFAAVAGIIIALSPWWRAALHAVVVPPLLLGSGYGLRRYLEDRHDRSVGTK
jgi:hypothetical protein